MNVFIDICGAVSKDQVSKMSTDYPKFGPNFMFWAAYWCPSENIKRKKSVKFLLAYCRKLSPDSTSKFLRKLQTASHYLDHG